MGWKYSPPYFCAATETGRDVAQQLLQEPALPPHPLEQDTMQVAEDLHLYQVQHPSTWTTEELPARLKNILSLLDIYVDDYTGAVQSTHPEVLRHHSRALLHGIHSIFPKAPEDSTNPAEDEPVSLKKLREDKEGVWAFRKEILGWIFDGIARTIELPPGKLHKIRSQVKELLRTGHTKLPDFQTLVGKLLHATLAIPNGKGLLSPLFKYLPSEHGPSNRRKHIQIPKGSEGYQALEDLRIILKMVANRPTRCEQLIPGWPHYVGFCDACKYGAGGVWLSGKDDLYPTVWRIKWPADITSRLISTSNPDGDLTITK